MAGEWHLSTPHIGIAAYDSTQLAAGNRIDSDIDTGAIETMLKHFDTETEATVDIAAHTHTQPAQ